MNFEISKDDASKIVSILRAHQVSLVNQKLPDDPVLRTQLQDFLVLRIDEVRAIIDRLLLGINTWPKV